jgi:hypothetical protein
MEERPRCARLLPRRPLPPLGAPAIWFARTRRERESGSKAERKRDACRVGRCGHEDIDSFW